MHHSRVIHQQKEFAGYIDGDVLGSVNEHLHSRRRLSGGINGSGGRSGIDVIGRNTFRLPRTQVVDLRLSKKFNFSERYAAEIMGQAYNLFNHVNATGVVNTAYGIATSGTTATASGIVTCTTTSPCLNYSSSFGKITNANSNFAYSSRQVEIGFRFLF